MGLIQTKVTPVELRILFNKKRDKVAILWDALDYMQQYNGRSKTDCIAIAMGYERVDTHNSHYYQKMTPQAEETT